MARLVFYQKDWEEHAEAFKRNINGDSDIQFIGRKLMRHFKIRCKIQSGGMRGGRAWIANWGYSTIRVPRECAFGILCHELAHVWQHEREGKTKHNKNLMKLIRRLNRYCEKRDYWKVELEKRNEPKAEKPEPTADEIRQGKIEKRRQQIKKYERKIHYYQSLKKRAERSLSGLMRYV